MGKLKLYFALHIKFGGMNCFHKTLESNEHLTSIEKLLRRPILVLVFEK